MGFSQYAFSGNHNKLHLHNLLSVKLITFCVEITKENFFNLFVGNALIIRKTN